MKTLLLIDGNSLANRAYFAFKKEHRNKEGVYMNAVWGMGKFLKNLKQKYQPAATIVAFDGAYNFRELMFPDYKGTRGEKDDDLVRQFPYIKELCLLMECSIMQKDGFEADDLIGILVRRCAGELYDNVKIISSDRDLLQLTTFPGTTLEIPVKGVSEMNSISKENCKEFYGVEANQVVFYKALAGDSSDNISGVKGVGDKSAKDIIEIFGDYDSLMDVALSLEEHPLLPSRTKKALLAKGGRESFQESLVKATILTEAKFDIMGFFTPYPNDAAVKKKAFMLENGLVK